MLLENYTELILKGIGDGDLIGGPKRLANILCQSLKANNGFNQNDLRSRYLNWWRTGAFDTGPTFASVFNKIDNGMNFELAVKKVHEDFGFDTAGCGPCHRAIPLAGSIYITNGELIKLAKEEAQITHFHDDAGNGSAIVVMLCRYLLENKNLQDSLNLIKNHEELKVSWSKVENAELNPNGYVYNVIYSALHFVKENKSLNDAIKFSGKANYCSVIVGAIMACLKKFNK